MSMEVHYHMHTVQYSGDTRAPVRCTTHDVCDEGSIAMGLVSRMLHDGAAVYVYPCRDEPCGLRDLTLPSARSTP